MHSGRNCRFWHRLVSFYAAFFCRYCNMLRHGHIFHQSYFCTATFIANPCPRTSQTTQRTSVSISRSVADGARPIYNTGGMQTMCGHRSKYLTLEYDHQPDLVRLRCLCDLNLRNNRCINPPLKLLYISICRADFYEHQIALVKTQFTHSSPNKPEHLEIAFVYAAAEMLF